ncbi:uncharacterized protein PAC_14639 [Phialocephala subalpina]|uniref:Uncharacterized protein n=1 Tax=Phialocephala subalpina TaxID=576137 RepID=A0A1L7XI76_9HELO|nr:uncharacterized protein PAC_14639 [Phialocephala subalpina]
MASEENISVEMEEEFIFPEDGARPTIDPPRDGNYKFMPDDKVWLCPSGTQDREGPYLIEKTENGKYSLCDEDGRTARGGEMFEEKDLILYDYFSQSR